MSDDISTPDGTVRPRRGTPQPTDHTILDAVISQNGKRYIQYGSERQNAWFALDLLQRSPTDVFQILSRAGIQIIAAKTREAFKIAVEAHQDYRTALVAEFPGWIHEGIYVCGDGEVIRGKQRTKILVSLKADPRFASRGTLEEWKAANARFLVGQPLVQLIYAYAFAGYLIGCAPPDFQNAIIEVVGDTGTGKTSLAVGAGSISGGNPQNSNGFALSWDRTNATADALQRQHRDNILILNESNLTGDDLVAQANYMRTAIMRYTEPGERETMNTTGDPIFSRFALLSTTNASICELIGGAARADGATRSRVVTFQSNRRHGIFDEVPAGFGNASNAVRAMVDAASRFYGTAGRGFVAHLCKYKHSSIRRLIERSFQELKKSSIASEIPDERALKTLALCKTAFLFAKELQLIPRGGESFDDILGRLNGTVVLHTPTTTRTPLEIVKSFVRDNAERFSDTEEMDQPISRGEFKQSCGFWIEGGERCVIPPPALKGVHKARRLLKLLKEAGDLDCELERLDKKVPSTICLPAQHCRGHFLRIAKKDL